MNLVDIFSWAAPAIAGLFGAWLGARVASSQAKLSEMMWIEERIRELNAGRERAYRLLSDLRKFGESWLVHDDFHVEDTIKVLKRQRLELTNLDAFQRSMAILIQDSYWTEGDKNTAIDSSNEFWRHITRLCRAIDNFEIPVGEETLVLQYGRPGAVKLKSFSHNDGSLSMRGTLELSAIIVRAEKLKISIYNCLSCIELHEKSLNKMYNQRAVSVFGYLPRKQWRRNVLAKLPRPLSKLHREISK